jgi:hypothetical protein
MRKIIFLSLTLSIALYSCTKNGGSGSSSGGGGNKPPAITDISPLITYPGDVITLTGTGFDPDKTRDTVAMGIIANKLFASNATFYFALTSLKTKIISATSTQIKFTTDSALEILPEPIQRKIAFQVKTSSGKFNTDTIEKIKENLSFYVQLNAPYPNNCYTAIFAGDSLTFGGFGFYKPVTVTLNGQGVNTVFDANNTTSGVGFLPLTYFGQGSPVVDCNLEQPLHVKVTNGDGRSQTKDYPYFPCPNSQVLGASMNALVYSKSGGGAALLTVTGYALRSDYELTVSATDDFANSSFTEKINLNAAGFPNSVVQQIDLGALPTPVSANGSRVVIEIRTLNAVGADAQASGHIIAGFTLLQ